MDKNGNPPTTTKEQLKRWAEHFRELLNRPTPDSTRHPILRNRTSHQLRQTLKGRDQEDHHDSEKWEDCRTRRIPAEAIKADVETAVNMLYSLFSKIWEKEEVPAQWKEGNQHQAAKERRPWGLQQLSRDHAPVNVRQDSPQGSTGEDEGGCRPQAPRPAGRLPAEQISCRQDHQNAHYRGTVTGVELPLYINFIDYEKAFDSVDRETMWKLLRHYGVPEKIISSIRCTFQDMSCRIAHAGQLSESFEEETGVQQGCRLSPFFFLLVIDWSMKTTTTGRYNGIQWTLWTQLDDLDFADDLALLSHNHKQMQDKTTPGDHISRDRAQDQQEKDRADEDEHNCQRTSHIWWRTHQGDGVFRLPGKCV